MSTRLRILTFHLTAADSRFSTGAVGWLWKSARCGGMAVSTSVRIKTPGCGTHGVSLGVLPAAAPSVVTPVPSPVSSESRAGACSLASTSWPTRIAEAIVGSLRQELPLASDTRPHRKLAGVEVVLAQELFSEPEGPDVFHNGIAIETGLFELPQHRLCVAKEAIDDAPNDFPREHGA